MMFDFGQALRGNLPKLTSRKFMSANNPARAEIPSRVSYYADSIRRIKTPF